MEKMIKGNVVSGCSVEGKILFSDEPLSFWGGYNQDTGEIIDRRHPLSGQKAGQQILAIPSSRGSTTTVSVLLEALIAGNSPAAILVQQVDSFFALASIIAKEIFGLNLPVVTLSSEDFSEIKHADRLKLYPDGRVILHMLT